jgi:tRNA-dihydrouridine synthase B
MQRMRDSGVDAIMLGRATLGNPWLITQIRDLMEGRPARPLPSAADRLRFALVHYRAMVDELGEPRAVPQMRKHIALYLRGIPGAAALRERIMRIDSAAEAVGTIEETIRRLECAPPVAA